MSDFTFAQAAAILGITPSAFSYRARTVKGVPFAQGPRNNARLVSLEDLERISGRILKTREIEYALAVKAPNWKRPKPQQVKRVETYAEYVARAMNAARAMYPGKTDEEIEQILVENLRRNRTGASHG